MSDVDVAAIREALDKLADTPDVFVRYGQAGVLEMLLDAGFMWSDAELIVLLRNNAEALLDAAEKWKRYCEAFEVKPPASSLRPMRTTSHAAEPDWSNGVHP